MDVEAAFYLIGLPEEMREFFGAGPARAGAAGLGWLGDERLHRGEKAAPVRGALPTGFKGLAPRELNVDWSPKVTAFDASERGHGAMERGCELGAIKYAGRFSD